MRELDNLPETGETGAAGSERDNIRHLPPGQCPGSVKLKTLTTRSVQAVSSSRQLPPGQCPGRVKLKTITGSVSRWCQALDTYQVSVQEVSSSRHLPGLSPGGVKPV